MATITIPSANWLMALADALETAQDGDILIVADEAAAELARRALARQKKPARIEIQIQERTPLFTPTPEPS